MPTPAIEHLRDIKTLPELVAHLRDELDWPISSNLRPKHMAELLAEALL